MTPVPSKLADMIREGVLSKMTCEDGQSVYALYEQQVESEQPVHRPAVIAPPPSLADPRLGHRCLQRARPGLDRVLLPRAPVPDE